MNGTYLTAVPSGWRNTETLIGGYSVVQTPCRYCSGNGINIYHPGACPRVKSIEYFPDGTIKRVEFFAGAADG